MPDPESGWGRRTECDEQEWNAVTACDGQVVFKMVPTRKDRRSPYIDKTWNRFMVVLSYGNCVLGLTFLC